MKRFALLALLLALPSAADAQVQEISRSIFTFGKRSLTIDVLVETPGVLRVLRGRNGEVKVAARARDGFADAALTERGGSRLSLTAIGSDRVEFVVVVPEDARIRVRLPDRAVSEIFGSMQDVATYAWNGRPLPNTVGPAGSAASAAVTEAPPLAAIEGLPIAYFSAHAPTRMSITHGGNVRRLSVRLEGVEFRVASNQPLAARPGSRDAVQIRAADDMELVIYLPVDTRDFLLDVDGDAALVVQDGSAAALCTPVTDQQLANGRRWFTFTPADGHLSCQRRPPAGIRQS